MPPKVTRPEGYAGLMERMAKTLGLDIMREAEALGLSEADIERLMHRCAGCSEPEDCSHRLAAPGERPLPPRYCPNRKLLLFLTAQNRSDDS
ncbi:DUF6455 family protein [Roseovarius ramblicola]|uniref:DUF6455 family protein n=1 Tax=Roseovarius ramblicola TaxID=2022336 RepID=A0ABV5I4Q7_9RHOB